MLVLKIITSVLIAYLGTAIALTIRNYKGKKDEITSLIVVEVTYVLSLICMWGG